MRNRLIHTLSTPYLQFLQKTASLSSSQFPQFKDITPERKKYKYLQADRRFFFHIFPYLGDDLRTQCPQLQLALKQADTSGDPIKVYNKDTYMEYHYLLYELLKRFRESLDALLKLKKSGNFDDLDEYVGLVMCLGDALQAMVGGCVIEMHLKVLETALYKPHHTMVLENQEAEYDEELHQISETLPMWQAYRDWLKLMVVHFDAVRILISHMQRIGTTDVTIKVLVSPSPGPDTLKWKEVLSNTRYFDEGLILGGPPTRDIIAFLEKWRDEQIKDGTKVAHVQNAIDQLRSSSLIKNEDIDEIVRMLSSLACCQSPGSSAYTTDLINTMRSLTDKSSKASEELINEVMTKLQSLRDSATLFNKLDSLSFKGSLHCELSLACFMQPLLSSKDPKYKIIVDELSVSCIVSIL
jgi:hypothetical protein